MQTQSALKWRVTSRTTRLGAGRRTTARPSTCAGASQRRRRRCPVAQSDSSGTWNRALSDCGCQHASNDTEKCLAKKTMCSACALQTCTQSASHHQSAHTHAGCSHLEVNAPREMAVPLLAAEQGRGADCVAHDTAAAAAANRCDLIQYADDGRFAQVPATITSRDSCIQGLERMTRADMSRPSATNSVLKSTRKPTRHNEHRMDVEKSGASLSSLSRKWLQLPPQSSGTLATAAHSFHASSHLPPQAH